MPRPKRSSSDIRDVVSQFVDRLSGLIEQETMARAREAVLSAFGGRAPSGLSLGRGRGQDLGSLAVSVGGVRKRRKGPIQLCPVPGCQNRAAPVFGMVCSKHKDLPKAQIKKYREARRAQKMKAKSGGAGRRGKRG